MIPSLLLPSLLLRCLLPIITQPSLPTSHNYPAIITPSLLHHYSIITQAIITQPPLPSHHYPATITKPSLPSHHYQPSLPTFIT
jgi:hypothetical protein